jgi:hypothetical protein
MQSSTDLDQPAVVSRRSLNLAVEGTKNSPETTLWASFNMQGSSHPSDAEFGFPQEHDIVTSY